MLFRSRPCTKHNWLVKDVKDLAKTIHKAFEVATTGRPGPVLVDIPKDIQFNKFSYSNEKKQKKTNGKTGEEFWVWLQLKVIADVGIIGLPNAGKSSLLAAITRARPKIANYPFTTLDPNLGVSYYDNKEVTLADIPGLVEGAHEGVGLGDKFLRHIERCKILLHLIDISEEDLVENYFQIRKELEKYDEDLSKKKKLLYLINLIY